MTSLNPEQLQASTHKSGPLLVLAGAGSGKTRIVTQRVFHLIASGVDPGKILAVTFTNKAAGEMLERIRHERRDGLMPLICTFHSLGAKILRESVHHLGYPNGFAIYDAHDSDELLKRCMQTLGLKGEDIKILRAHISYAKNNLIPPADANENACPHFKTVYTFYEERLKECGALDFDDLLYLPVRLFQEKKEVLEMYQERWEYLLVDEYQDTNHAQYLLARLIVEKSTNLFVVGDPDQSIYSWRGANIRNILNFEKDFPGARIVKLEQNYRSRKIILDAANALIENNKSRFKKRLWSAKEGGEKISLFVAESDRQEAQFVVEEIEHLYRHEGIALKEMAIFYRTNFQSRAFEDFLLRKKLPYAIVGGLSFYQRKEIKDILAFLHMVQSNDNFIAFARTINLPKRGIGDVTLEKIRERAAAASLSLFSFCTSLISGKGEMRLSEKQRGALTDYVSLISFLREKAQGSLQELVEQTIRKSGYLAVLAEDKETFEDRKANIEELISKAAEWESEVASPSLQAFLEELSLKSSLDEVEMGNDKLSLMTIHNGKGLEFDTVFLVGMEEDLFPHANSRGSFEAVEEERRLCYVGMTRAKERLYLSAAEKRLLWGSLRMMRPSRFLREIPRDYITRI